MPPRKLILQLACPRDPGDRRHRRPELFGDGVDRSLRVIGHKPAPLCSPAAEGESAKLAAAGEESPRPGKGSLSLEAGEAIALRTPGCDDWGCA